MAERKVIELESGKRAREVLDLIAGLSQAQYSFTTGRFTVVQGLKVWEIYQEGLNIVVEQAEPTAKEAKP